MPNTLGTPVVRRERSQFQGLFSVMWNVKVTITDQDAIALNDTLRFPVTVPGVVLGDVVFAYSITNDLSDGTDQVVMGVYVTAADTVNIQFTADVAAYAIDDLNDAVVKFIIGRPTW